MKSAKVTNISAATKKLNTIVKLIPDDRRAIGESLVTELQFMASTLEDLRSTIKESGPVDLFVQGRQKFIRENPALKAYNTTIQRYSLLYKQLVDLLPKPVQADQGGALREFLKQA